MKDRAYRRDQNQRVITKRLKLLKKYDNNEPDSSGKTYYEHMAEEPGRLRKRHPYDCGNSKCMICHLEKILKLKRARDKKQENKANEEMEGQAD